MRWSRLKSVVAFLGVVCLGAGISLFAVSHVENFGPQGMVQTADGDIHRHDFVRRWGWPWPCVEHFTANWYVYHPSGVRPATPEQIETWSKTRIAELEHSVFRPGGVERYERYRASAEGDFWRINPNALLMALGVWFAFTGGAAIARQGLIRFRQARRLTSRLCVNCGYDLRATPDRCPECGTTTSDGSRSNLDA